MGYLHRFQGCILPHTNSQSVKEVHAFSHPGSVLPVQSPTLWPVHSTNGVHSGGQRGQTDGFTEGYKNPPVPRRLIGECHIPPNLSPAYTDLGSPLSRIRLAGEQECSRTGSKPKIPGALQLAIFSTQTQQPVETYLGPEYLPKHRVVQNGDTRDNKNLLIDRGVGYLHRFQGCILPHTNSQSVKEVHAFSHPGSVLPVQSPTLWPVHSTNGVHSGGQRGQTDGFTEGYKNPPVPRRLIGECHIPPNLSPAYTDLGSPLSRIRLAGEQECSRTGSKPKIPGALQLAIFSTQTQQPVETYLGPEYLPKHRVVQNGDTRDNKNLLIDRGVGYLHRFQGCILPHTNSQSVKEVHAFSHPGSILPVQSPTLWPVHSTNGVHSGGQRGQTDGFTEGYKNPPVPRRLIGECHIPPNLSPAYTDLGSPLSRIRLAGEQGKVRTGPKTGFQLRRLPVRPERGQGQTHTRALAGPNRQDSVNPVRSGLSSPAVHVPPRSTHSNRKAGPPTATPYETHTVEPEKQLEGSRITRKGDTSSQVASTSLKMVAGGKQCSTRSTITPSKACSADLYRHIKRRVGLSLK